MRALAIGLLAFVSFLSASGIGVVSPFRDSQQTETPVKRKLVAARDYRARLAVQRIEVAAIGPSRGPENAPVTIIEFSDFQCPFCSRLVSTLEQVREKYGDKVRLVFRQFPLSFHTFASKAAEAALCAHEQGKFWEMHDAMFANQQQLSIDDLKSKAAELGLNAEQFNSNLDSGKYADAVQRDKLDGQKAGVGATPALFINGRFMSGAQPFEAIAKVIDDELARMNSGND